MRFKKRFLFLPLLLISITCCQTQTAEQSGVHHGVGVVVRVEPQNRLIEINHEEIKNYMPAMQMEYRVRDPGILNSLKAGDKIEFTLEEHNNIETITAIRKL